MLHAYIFQSDSDKVNGFTERSRRPMMRLLLPQLLTKPTDDTINAHMQLVLNLTIYLAWRETPDNREHEWS